MLEFQHFIAKRFNKNFLTLQSIAERGGDKEGGERRPKDRVTLVHNLLK
jgi:hypothetical protein